MENATITQHIDILAPGVFFLLKALVWLVGLLGSALLAVLIWLGRQFASKIGNMDRKLDTLHDAMLTCDGCKNALAKLGNRPGDDDGSDL